jgi:lysophospholipase L1-like esterase
MMYGIVKNMQETDSARTDSGIMKVEGGKLRINKRKLKIAALAVLLIFFIVYAIGEVAVRIISPQALYNKHHHSHPTYPKEVAYDEGLGWSTVKNYKVEPYSPQDRNPIVTITHNSKGYRMDEEVNPIKQKVVMTGDSLTYGFWVDDDKVVSAKLNEMLGDDYQVINLGVGGYGTDQSLLRFLRDGSIHGPKIVVHSFFANDFSNIVSKYQYNVYKPLFVVGQDGSVGLTGVPVPVSPDMERSYPKQKEHPIKGFERLMKSWSHLYVLYKTKIGEIKTSIRKSFQEPVKIDYFNDYKDGEMWAIEKDYTDIMNYSFYLNGMLLKKYNEVAKENNATFVLVLIADRVSVDREMQQATLARYYNVDERFFDYEKPYRLLEKLAKENGIIVVNLYPVFKEEFEKGNDMYLIGDHHLNDYGHELYARKVYEELKRDGVIEDNAD